MANDLHPCRATSRIQHTRAHFVPQLRTLLRRSQPVKCHQGNSPRSTLFRCWRALRERILGKSGGCGRCYKIWERKVSMVGRDKVAAWCTHSASRAKSKRVVRVLLGKHAASIPGVSGNPWGLYRIWEPGSFRRWSAARGTTNHGNGEEALHGEVKEQDQQQPNQSDQPQGVTYLLLHDATGLQPQKVHKLQRTLAWQPFTAPVSLPPPPPQPQHTHARTREPTLGGLGSRERPARRMATQLYAIRKDSMGQQKSWGDIFFCFLTHIILTLHSGGASVAKGITPSLPGSHL